VERQITLAEAEALFDELRDGFANLARTMERIIATRAWEVMGYSSFAAAWRIHMSGVPLRTNLERALVIYELGETETPEEIAALVPEVGPVTVEAVLNRKALGLAAKGISMRKCGADEYIRREHPVKKPGARRKVHVDLGEERYQELLTLCSKVGTSPRQEIEAAIVMRIDLLRRAALSPSR
jgi:hypothetical protein